MPLLISQADHRIISAQVIIAVVLAGIGVSYLLIPSDQELLNRMARDQLSTEIQSVISKGLFDRHKSAADLLSSMPTERVAFIANLSRLTPREQMHVIFDPKHAVEYDAFMHYFVASAIRYVDVIPPAEAYSIIAPVAARIPERPRNELFRALAKNALSISNPELAAMILRKQCFTTTSDWETMNALIEADRWAGKPADAHRDLQVWLVQNRDELTSAVEKEAEAMLFTLALEANHPKEAFEWCVQQLEECSPDRALPTVLIERAFRSSVFAGETARFMPWLERRLSEFPEHKLTWQELIKANRESADEQRPDYRLWMVRAAQLADWNSMNEAAYAYHLRLVALGEASSVERFLAMAAYLGRGQDVASVLAALGPVEGHDELQLTLARQLASNGDAVAAIKLFDQWVVKHPDDQSARREHACLVEALRSPAEAIHAFEQLLAAFPHDAEMAMRLFDVLNRTGKHAQALALLDKLPADSFDADALENYVMLAESLDRPDSLKRALELQIDKADTPDPQDYLRLAEIVHYRDGDSDGLAVLQRGIERLPKDETLRAALAGALLQDERFDEALDAALVPEARSSIDAASTAISAAVHTTRAQELLQALGDDFEKRTRLSDSTKLDLAVACHQAGQMERAAALFASVRETPGRLIMLAQARLQSENYDEAVRLARVNLASKATPASADWLLLGDALSKQGRIGDANEAYGHALQMLTARLTQRDDTSSLSSP